MIELDEELREAGERWRAGQRAPVTDFRRATAAPHRSRRPRRSRMLVVGAVAAVAIVVTSAVLGFGGGDSSPRKVVVTQPTSPTTAPEAPSVLTLDPEIMQTEALAIDGSSVWVTGDAPQSRAATLEHIDTATGDVLGKVVLGDNGPFQIVVGDNAIWVASQQNEESAHVTKVDPRTMRVTAVIETAGDASVAVTPDAVWVDDNTATLLRLDPDTNKVLATIPLPGGPYSAHFITAGSLGIFLTNNYDGTVLRVDPETNTVETLTDIGDSAGDLVELDGWLWINANNFVAQIDPVTGVFQRTVPGKVRNLVSDGRALWMATDTRKVFRIDPRTGLMTIVQLPPDVGFAIALAGDPVTGAVWAASDPPTQRLVRLAPQ